jgi:hypothetical protein
MCVQETRDSHDHETPESALLHGHTSTQSRKNHISIIYSLLDCSRSGVERPLPSSSSSGRLGPFLFDRKGPLSSSRQRWSAWAQLFTQRLWSLGYQEDALASILDALPADFCSAIQAASKQVWGVIQAAAAASAAPGAAAAGQAEISEPAFLECLEDIWERDAQEGFIEFAFDPATQQRSNVILNSATASLAGMHKEEVARRPPSFRLPLPTHPPHPTPAPPFFHSPCTPACARLRLRPSFRRMPRASVAGRRGGQSSGSAALPLTALAGSAGS